MKSLFLQKLYHLQQGAYYAIAVAMLVLEVGLLILNCSEEYHSSVDFWTTGLVVCVMLLSFANGSETGWAKYRAVMPMTRRQTVTMEYLFLLGSAAVFALIVSVFPLIMMLKNNDFDGKLLFFGTVSVFVCPLSLFLLTMPMQIRFGEKGFFIFFGCLLLLLLALEIFTGGLGIVVVQLGEFIMTHDMLIMGWCELGVAALLTALSWLLSALLCTKREI